MLSFTFMSESLRFSRTDATRVYFDFHRRMRDRQDPDYRENRDYEDYEQDCYYVNLTDHQVLNNGRYGLNFPGGYLEYEIERAELGGNPVFRIYYSDILMNNQMEVDYLTKLRYARSVESHFTMNPNQIDQWFNLTRVEDLNNHVNEGIRHIYEEEANPANMEVEVEDQAE
jgi:hypothetical protein